MTGVPGSPEKRDRRCDPFIKLLRRFDLHRFWQERRVYSHAEAWIDMLFMAFHSSSKVDWNGQTVSLEPGEFMTSYRILARRWQWSVKKVRYFLQDCETHRELILNNGDSTTQPRAHQGTHVTITNYAEIHRSGAHQRTHPTDTLKENVVTRENTGRATHRKSRPSVTTSRLPSCDRKPGDGVSESEQAAVRLAIREAGFGGE